MRRVLAGTAIAAALIGLTASSAQAATPHWKITQTNNFAGDDGIDSIAVTPGGAAWSTGFRTVNDHPVPLVQHLTSKGWKSITPPGGSSFTQVGGLTASSNENVWTFGASQAARWNGKRWTVTNLTSNFAVQDAVALSPSNVWAVGGSSYRYADHWNGRKWAKVAMPGTAGQIAAVSAKSLWAAGINGHQPTVMHWNGKAWKLVKTPAFKLPDPAAYGVLHDIVAISDKNVWAVGGLEWQCDEVGHDSCNFPITLHWNGHTWSTTVGPEGTTSYDKATSDGAGGLWMLNGSWDPTLVHAVKGHLTSVAAPRPAGSDVYLTALASRGKTIWTAGDSQNPTSIPSVVNGIYLRNG